MDDGILTDSQGRRVDFKNTIIVMTSNIGAKNITERRTKLGFSSGETSSDGTMSYDEIREAVMGDLKKTFRPEFLNRIDEIIVFHQLSAENIREIADKMLDIVKQRIADMGIKLTADSDALDVIAKRGFDPVYGARPLKRAIQSTVEDKVAELILDGEIKEGDTVAVTTDDGELLITEPKLLLLQSFGSVFL